MLKLNVVQAEFGDCFVLRFGSIAKPQFILIDGGPSGTYTRHLQPEIEKIRASGNCLKLLILSHVDNDHIIGLLEMMADVVNQRAAAHVEQPRVGAHRREHRA